MPKLNAHDMQIGDRFIVGRNIITGDGSYLHNEYRVIGVNDICISARVMGGEKANWIREYKDGKVMFMKNEYEFYHSGQVVY